MKVFSILFTLVSSFAFVAASEVDTNEQSQCTDSPPGWTDSVKNDCGWYFDAPQFRCDSVADLFTVNGRSAKNACCACGGGDMEPDTVDYNGRWYLRSRQQNLWISVRNSVVNLGFRNSNAIIEIEALMGIGVTNDFILKSPSNGGALLCIGNDENTVVANRGATFSNPRCKFVITPVSQDGMTVRFTNPWTGRTIEPFFNRVVQTTESDNSGDAEIDLQPVGNFAKSALRSSS